MSESDTFITLREAAEISGYTPDYVGQLIRKGKLPGKQVQRSVSWVTTKEALLSYLESANADGPDRPGKGSERELAEKVIAPAAAAVVRMALSVSAVALVALLLVLFYALSVTLDKRFEERALEQATQTP